MVTASWTLITLLLTFALAAGYLRARDSQEGHILIDIPVLTLAGFDLDTSTVKLKSENGVAYELSHKDKETTLSIGKNRISLSDKMVTISNIANLIKAGVPVGVYEKVLSIYKGLGDTGSGEKALTWQLADGSKVIIFPDDQNLVMSARTSVPSHSLQTDTPPPDP